MSNTHIHLFMYVPKNLYVSPLTIDYLIGLAFWAFSIGL